VTRRRGRPHRPEIARLARLAARGALVLACVAGLEAIAAARPGGGESFSGGGGHSQGGGGGGGAGLIFELVFWLFRLVFLYPAIGLPIIAVVVGYVIYSAHRQRQNIRYREGTTQVKADRKQHRGEIQRIRHFPVENEHEQRNRQKWDGREDGNGGETDQVLELPV